MTASGFYHCSVKPVGRTNGRSIVAAAAYRTGQRLEDERTGEVFDYRARSGVVDTFILARENAPAWAHDRARLWNEAERAEPRANGRLATEFELALPHELTAAQRKELLADYLRPLIERHGVAADVAIHAPGADRDHRNIHAHVLITHRELGADGFGEIANQRTMTRKRKGREVQEKVAGLAATPAIRRDWEQHVNRAYGRAGQDIRVDHRSHEDRGIAQEPTKHLGPTATEMEQRELGSSERGAANREITQRNAARVLAAMRETEASQIVAEITSLKADLAMQDARAAAQGRTDDTRAVFTAAAARTTEPAAEIFDRDAANSEWEDKIAAAAIAKEIAQEARQSPEPDTGNETRARAGEPSDGLTAAGGAYQRDDTAQSEPAAAAKTDRADRTPSRIFGGLAAVAETMLGGILNFFGSGEPKLTAQQARDKARAEGNEETLHARAAAEAEQATRADQDWRIFEQNSQQRQQQHDAEMGLSERFGTPPSRTSGRERDDRGYERER